MRGAAWLQPTRISLKKFAELAVNFGAFSENVGVRLTILEDGQKRLIDATYANGEPGIKEKIREHDKVITEIVGGGTQPVREISSASKSWKRHM